MRENNWVARREVEGPKKITDVHEDAKREVSGGAVVLTYRYLPCHRSVHHASSAVASKVYDAAQMLQNAASSVASSNHALPVISRL